MKRIAIIGGGAAGLAATAAAGEAARQSGRDVSMCLYEASDRVGRPILATGNGRCNFSNLRIDADEYHNAPFVRAALDAFEGSFPHDGHPNGVVAFFAGHGMLYREEAEGRLYPLANKASVVLDVLRACVRSAGVDVRLESKVASVEPPRAPGSPFTMRMADGAFERADAVIVACGGKVAKAMLPYMDFRDQSPVLCPLATDVEYVRELDNIRAKATLGLLRGGELIGREAGEVMFRKYGISGICAFNLSRLARPEDELSVDFLPLVHAAEVRGFAQERLESLQAAYPGRLDCEAFLRGMVLPRVGEVVLKRCGLSEGDAIDAQRALELLGMLKDFRAKVLGPGDVEHAQVQRGGFAVDGFDPASLEAHGVPGLHVVGEALDVDGPCGGYNLHWAFATGMMAGRSCVL